MLVRTASTYVRKSLDRLLVPAFLYLPSHSLTPDDQSKVSDRVPEHKEGLRGSDAVTCYEQEQAIIMSGLLNKVRMASFSLLNHRSRRLTVILMLCRPRTCSIRTVGRVDPIPSGRSFRSPTRADRERSRVCR